MNNRSLENTLTGLIPTLTGPLPRELVDLAQSLIALSRQRVGSLKPNEEGARAYVCAQIACERLRSRLDLPPIEPRPPLPKRQYSTLHSQFITALPSSSNQPSGTASTRLLPSRAPKRVPPPPKPTSKTPTPTDPLTQLVHLVCNSPLLTPEPPFPPARITITHLLSGAIAIDIPRNPSGTKETIDSLANIAALYILATLKLSGLQATGSVYTDLRTKLCQVLEAESKEWGCAKAHQKGKGAISTSSSSSSSSKLHITAHDIDAALKSLMSHPSVITWLSEISTNPSLHPPVPPAPLTPTALLAAADAATAFEPWIDEDELVQQSGKQKRKRGGETAGAGIGRMVQDRVDYLSEKKRRGYVEWKEGVLRRVGEIERVREGGNAGAGSRSAGSREETKAAVAVLQGKGIAIPISIAPQNTNIGPTQTS